MNFFKRLHHLSAHELRSLASFCGGAAILIAIALVLSSNALLSYSLNNSAAVVTFNSNGTYTVPAGVTGIYVTVVGGGGGSGGALFNGDGQGGAGGGSGGVVLNQYVSVTPNQQITAVVGAGGAGGNAVACGGGCAPGPGSAGGPSTFGSITATGGQGGNVPPANGGAGGNPGGAKGVDSFTYDTCETHAGGDNLTGYGKGGTFSGGCYTAGTPGQSGAVVINTSPVVISASPQSVTSPGASTVSWASTSVDANSCSVSGPSGTLLTATPPAFASTALNATFLLAPVFSSDGSKAITASKTNNGSIYVSTNGGTTWGAVGPSMTSRNWYGVAANQDGTVLAAANSYNSSGYIYISATSTASWVAVGSPDLWEAITMSANGQNLAAVAGSAASQGKIFTSGTGGASWASHLIAAGIYFTLLASDSSGSNLVAAVYNQTPGASHIETSTNGGLNWTDRTSVAGTKGWLSIAESSDGSKILATSNGGGVWLGTGTGANFGANWVQVSALTASGASISADGNTMVIDTTAGIYKSTNGGAWTLYNATPGAPTITPDGTRVFVAQSGGMFGQYPGATTWVPQTAAGSHYVISIASDSTGTKLVDADPGGSVYTSTNGGVSWTPHIGGAWGAVTSSADGSHLAAAVGNGAAGGLYMSTTTTATWIEQTAIPTNNWWAALAYSADGSTLIAGSHSDYNNAAVYVTHNGGINWTTQQVSPTVAFAWFAVAANQDGTKLAAANGSDLFVSLNGGSSWLDRHTTFAPYEVVYDSAGDKLIATDSVNTYVSTDDGVSWTTKPNNPGGIDIASSANGNILSEAVSTGAAQGVYVSTNGGTSWIKQTSLPSGNIQWTTTAMSADGSKLITGVYGPATYSIYTLQNDHGTISGSYNATNITAPQTYTISCTLNGAPVSANTTITLAAPALTLNASSPVSAGSSSSLTWGASNINANSCSVAQIDNTTGIDTTVSGIGAGDNQVSNKLGPTLTDTGINSYTYKLYCSAPYTAGNNFTLSNNPSSVAGKFSQALQFSGGSSATTPSTSILDTDTHTISFWIKFAVGYIPAGWDQVLFYRPAGSDRSPSIWVNPQGDCLHWRYNPGNTGVANCAGPSGENSYFTPGVWYLVTGTDNNGSFRLYINGVQTESGTVAFPKDPGAAQFGVGGGNAQVAIDDLRVYNTALAPDRIQALYTGGHVTGGLVGYWPFDTTSISGTTAYDLAGGGMSTQSQSVSVSGPPILSVTPTPTSVSSPGTASIAWASSNINAGSCSVVQVTPGGTASTLSAIGSGDNNSTGKTTGALTQGGTYTYKLACTTPYTAGSNGTSVGSPTSAPGVANVGQALSFNGTSQYLTVPAPASSALDLNTTPVTISAWIKTNSLASSQRILARGLDGNQGYALSVATDGTIHVGSMGGSSFASTGTITTGVWYHVVGIINGASSKVYINGVDETPATVNVTIPATTQPLLVGAGLNASTVTPEQFFNGTIDDVRVYSRALSADEVSTLYNGGHITSGQVAYWPLDTNSISGTTVYDFAGGMAGATASAGVSVTSASPPAAINPFTATRAGKGKTSTLSWTVSGMNAGISCTMNPPLPAGIPTWNNINPWSASGVTGPINQSTTYTLSCGNGTASTTASVLVGLLPGFQEL